MTYAPTIASAATWPAGSPYPSANLLPRAYWPPVARRCAST